MSVSAENLTEPTPQPKVDCPACKGAGFVYPNVPLHLADGDFNPKAAKAVPCEAEGCYGYQWRHRREIKAKWEEKFGRRFTLDTFKGRDKSAKEMRALATDLLSNAIRWALIYGGTGNGKTHLMRALEDEFRKRSRQVRYLDMQDLMREYYAAIKANESDVWVRGMKDLDVLLLDELKLDNDKSVGLIEEILSSRYSAARTTVVVSNSDLAQLPERLQSRFGDKKISRVILNKGSDMR